MSKKLIDLPVGTLVKDNTSSLFGETITWRIADHNHIGYPDKSTTLITDKIIGILAYDVEEPRNPDTDYQERGNSIYSLSNVIQWLNSKGSANKWYRPTHKYDEAPNIKQTINSSNYITLPAFLNEASQFIRLFAIPTEIKTICKDETIDICTNKVFLLSKSEVGLAGASDIEGSALACFTDDASRMAYPTAMALRNYGYGQSQVENLVNSSHEWWTRTVSIPNSGNLALVNNDGSWINTTKAGFDSGVRPCINVPNTLTVKDEPDTDGAYILIPHKKLILFKADPDTYLVTSDDEYLYTEEGFAIVTADIAE